MHIALIELLEWICYWSECQFHRHVVTLSLSLFARFSSQVEISTRYTELKKKLELYKKFLPALKYDSLEKIENLEG